MTRQQGEADAATGTLRVRIGQATSAGPKAHNQDFHGACVPKGLALRHKGIAVALADGIGSSPVSHLASETAVNGFLADYYCTSDAWSVKESARRVLAATNAWLHAQTLGSRYREDFNRGYVCTLSVLVLRSASAHVFHVGDARVYRRREGEWELLTVDHRVPIGPGESCLSRAMGVRPHLECDYLRTTLMSGDLFMLVTDGVHGFVRADQVDAVLARCDDDLEAAARQLIEAALAQGSDDNLTVQFVEVLEVPASLAGEDVPQEDLPPCPPPLSPRMLLDGYRLVRPLQESSRSHVWLARDEASGSPVVLKVPSTESRDDVLALRRLLLEDWVARRLDSPHVLKAFAPERPRRYLYSVCEYVDGYTLDRWMRDHPRPSLERVRHLIEQMVRGVRAFHRQEMLHQDLRPGNVLVDDTETLRIIDFGAVRIAGLAEDDDPLYAQHRLGTAQYCAPEYFTGAPASPQSDQFSVAVMAWQMLTGDLPYGNAVAQVRDARDLHRLVCAPLSARRPDLPPWVERALRRGLHPFPHRRFPSLSEFVQALRAPGDDAGREPRRPLVERNPLAFWKGLSLGLALLSLALGLRLALGAA